MSNRSMSDTGSPEIQLDPFHSPIRSESPLHFDDPEMPPERPPVKLPSPMVVSNWLAREEEEVAAGVTKVGPAGRGEGFGGGGVGGERRSRAAVVVKRVELGFRVCEVILCLISSSVMTADKNRGWSGDSFYRYKEYRYSAAVTIIGCIYSGLQACYLSYRLITEKHIVFPFHHLRYHFNFAMDQILAYLLVSASSSAATRVDDWASNWGEDEFTEMAAASIGMSFLAFAAFSLNSLISGYNLCNYITS